jgi:hypothetical protein
MAKVRTFTKKNGPVTVVGRTVWLGSELQLRMRAAMGKALVIMGITAASSAKQYAHVGAGTAIPGTLRRSIHSAGLRHDGGSDQQMAATADLENAGYEDIEWGSLGFEPALLVGSWVDYACVEESGRGHRFIQPAIESLRGEATAIMVAAWKSEGL